MIYKSKDNPNSHLTVKDRKYPSLPLRFLFEKGLIVGDILDYGCGLGKDVDHLKKLNINVVGYDPFYFPNYPQNKFNTIICFYVLNVLLPEEQSHVLMSISELLKLGGKAYFAVRRDIKRNGFLFNPKHKVKTYQCDIILPFKSIFKNENTEIYEYQHFTFLNVCQQNTSPFFNGKEVRELITESATAFAIYDKYPVSIGHALIVPKRLISNFFDLSNHEQTACLIVLNRVKAIIVNKYNPDGFNVGINIGEYGGQTILQAHIHLIPRYKNDILNPRGGIRAIIPNKKDY
ncbi:MAG: bifunctional class I SAM-dependent methyltransferase/HIT family protein [Ignavibacteriales bacterium]|nr:bifunctional class I SAM-dependent methyltransferase/HIT family protein [Ignavibacteriales bacterium]